MPGQRRSIWVFQQGLSGHGSPVAPPPPTLPTPPDGFTRAGHEAIRLAAPARVSSRGYTIDFLARRVSPRWYLPGCCNAAALTARGPVQKPAGSARTARRRPPGQPGSRKVRWGQPGPGATGLRMTIVLIDRLSKVECVIALVVIQMLACHQPKICCWCDVTSVSVESPPVRGSQRRAGCDDIQLQGAFCGVL